MQRMGTAILAILAVVMTLGALWYVNRPVIAREPTRQEVQAQAKNGGYRLINTAELAALVRQEGQKVSAGGHPPALGVPHRSHQGGGQFFYGAHPVGQVAVSGPLARFLGPDRDRLIVFY